MRYVLSIIFVFIVSISYGQTNSWGKLEILNTCVVKKPRHNSVKLEVRLSGFSDGLDTICFKHFYQFTPPLLFVYDSISLNEFKEKSTGLHFLVENDDGFFIEASEGWEPQYHKYRDGNDGKKNPTLTMQVNKKTLRVKFVKIDINKFNIYEVSKLLVSTKDTVVDFYPLLHLYNNLTPGRYKLFLFYSYNKREIIDLTSGDFLDCKQPNKMKVYNGQVYNGYMMSNKIDLIVK